MFAKSKKTTGKSVTLDVMDICDGEKHYEIVNTKHGMIVLSEVDCDGSCSAFDAAANLAASYEDTIEKHKEAQRVYKKVKPCEIVLMRAEDGSIEFKQSGTDIFEKDVPMYVTHGVYGGSRSVIPYDDGDGKPWHLDLDASKDNFIIGPLVDQGDPEGDMEVLHTLPLSDAEKALVA
jgi:hypothetical protein